MQNPSSTSAGLAVRLIHEPETARWIESSIANRIVMSCASSSRAAQASVVFPVPFVPRSTSCVGLPDLTESTHCLTSGSVMVADR